MLSWMCVHSKRHSVWRFQIICGIGQPVGSWTNSPKDKEGKKGIKDVRNGFRLPSLLFALLWKKGNIQIKIIRLSEKGYRACVEMWTSLSPVIGPTPTLLFKEPSREKCPSQLCASGTLPALCKPPLPPPLLQPCQLLS